MQGGQVQMLSKQKGFSEGEAWHSPLCVAALQGAAEEPHANDGHSFL